MALDFNCPHCEKRISADALPGDKALCPHCRTKVTVPANAGAPAPVQSPNYTPPGEPDGDELKAQETDALMGVMANITPWIISFFFHAGLALVMMFVVMVITRQDVPEQIIVSTGVFSQDPGGTMSPGEQAEQFETRRETAQEQLHHAREESAIPADTGSTENRIELISVGSEIASGGAMAKLGLDSDGGTDAPRSAMFGTGSNAHHIVYLMDYSGSMAMLFEDVRKEMLVDISRMNPPQDYHIILFYGWGDYIENPPGQLVSADYDHKAETGRFFQTLQTPQGSGKGYESNVIPAFQRAFDVLAKADKDLPGKVIYFLTDGLLSDPEKLHSAIRAKNAAKDVKINTFLYAHKDPHAVKILTQIADENGGKFKYVSWDE